MTQPADDLKTTTAKILLLAMAMSLAALATAQTPFSCTRDDFVQASGLLEEARSGEYLELVGDISTARARSHTGQQVTEREVRDLRDRVVITYREAEELRSEVEDLMNSIDQQASPTNYRLVLSLSQLSIALTFYANTTLGSIYFGDQEEVLGDESFDFEFLEARSSAATWLHFADLSCRLDQAGIE